MRCVRSWAASLLLVALIAAPAAAAQPDSSLPDLQIDSAPCPDANLVTMLEQDGQPGFWFPSETARCMLVRLQSLPLYARQVELLEQRLSLSDQRDSLLRAQIQLLEQSADAADGALLEAVRGQRRAEEKLHAWYRHPAVLIGVGAFLVGIAAVTLKFGFH